jgi:hypothetical protein
MAEPHYRVVARDGIQVGRVEHVVSERGETRASGLVVSTSGGLRVLPLTAIAKANGASITLRDSASAYRELQHFHRARYRVIDEEMAVAEELDEDFLVGAEDPAIDPESRHEDPDAAREQHTGAENHHRAPVQSPDEHDPGLAHDPEDLDDGPEDVVAARTRRNMH